MTTKPWLSLYPEKLKGELVYPEISLPEMLKQSVDKYSNNTATVFYGHEMTYRELWEKVRLFASALQNQGLQKGDRVAIMLPNCPHYLIAYYGILLAGGTVAQVNPMYTERELLHLLSNSGAQRIIVFDALYPKVQAVSTQVKLDDVIVVSFGQTFTPEHVGTYTFEQYFTKATGTVQEVVLNPKEDVAVLQYTGGTTGVSKGAMLTHSNLIANTYQCLYYFEESFRPGEDRVLTVIPLFHVYGMTSCMNLSILNGAANILLPRFDLNELLETIKQTKPTSFPGVPTMYIALLNHPKASEYGIDSIRVCNSGSAPMPIEIMKEFEQKTGAKVLEGYGLSEASPTTHCNPPFAARKPGSVGLPFPGTDCKVMDLETGENEVPVGETGELIIKGPQVMKGYWNMPEETAHTLKDSWLYTGDIGKMDEDGFFYIIDRKKDMIIAGGYNIYPRDVEEVLYEHPAVQEAVVVGVPDPYRGQNVKAVLVVKQDQNVTVQQLEEYCRQHLAAYKIPRIFEFRESLPKTAVGKILRRVIQDEAKAQN